MRLESDKPSTQSYWWISQPSTVCVFQPHQDNNVLLVKIEGPGLWLIPSIIIETSGFSGGSLKRNPSINMFSSTNRYGNLGHPAAPGLQPSFCGTFLEQNSKDPPGLCDPVAKRRRSRRRPRAKGLGIPASNRNRTWIMRKPPD